MNIELDENDLSRISRALYLMECEWRKRKTQYPELEDIADDINKTFIKIFEQVRKQKGQTNG